MALVVGDIEHAFTFDEGDILHVDESDNTRLEPGRTSTLRAQLDGDGSVRRVVVWLPHNCSLPDHALTRVSLLPRQLEASHSAPPQRNE